MRLLLRANSHRAVASGGVELAAAPDTPGRERWQWHLRLEYTDRPECPGTRNAAVELGDGSAARLSLSYDPDAVEPECGTVELTERSELTRREHEMLALVVGKGTVLVEGRHLLAPRDCLILEGDEPMRVSIEPVAGEDTSMVVFRLSAAGERTLGWVP